MSTKGLPKGVRETNVGANRFAFNVGETLGVHWKSLFADSDFADDEAKLAFLINPRSGKPKQVVGSYRTPQEAAAALETLRARARDLCSPQCKKCNSRSGSTVVAPSSVTTAEDIICTECGGGDSIAGNDILLCDGLNCLRCYHQQCCGEADVPAGAWLCSTCVAAGNGVDPRALETASAGPEAVAPAVAPLHHNGAHDGGGDGDEPSLLQAEEEPPGGTPRRHTERLGLATHGTSGKRKASEVDPPLEAADEVDVEVDDFQEVEEVVEAVAAVDDDEDAAGEEPQTLITQVEVVGRAPTHAAANAASPTASSVGVHEGAGEAEAPPTRETVAGEPAPPASASDAAPASSHRRFRCARKSECIRECEPDGTHPLFKNCKIKPWKGGLPGGGQGCSEADAQLPPVRPTGQGGTTPESEGQGDPPVATAAKLVTARLEVMRAQATVEAVRQQVPGPGGLPESAASLAPAAAQAAPPAPAATPSATPSSATPAAPVTPSAVPAALAITSAAPLVSSATVPLPSALVASAPPVTAAGSAPSRPRWVQAALTLLARPIRVEFVKHQVERTAATNAERIDYGGFAMILEALSADDMGVPIAELLARLETLQGALGVEP